MSIFKFNIEAEVDIDELWHIFYTSSDIKNTLNRELGMEGTSLIYSIVNNALSDLKAQIPSIDDDVDDPFAKPNPDQGISPPIFDGDDPFAGVLTPDVEPPTGEEEVEGGENPDAPEENA